MRIHKVLDRWFCTFASLPLETPINNFQQPDQISAWSPLVDIWQP